MTDQNDVIRLADKSDLAWLAERDEHISREVLKKKIADGEVYLLECNGTCAGFLRYNLFWDNTPFLNLVFVREEYRMSGYGRELVFRWEDDMREKGFSVVMTSTQSNEEAQHFYRKLGYIETGGFKPPDECFELIFMKLLGPNFDWI